MATLERAGDSGARHPVGPGQQFLSRRPELETLEAIALDVEAGRPQSVLIEGAPGMGKTALAREFLSGRDGWTVLEAACDDTERHVPWGVFDQLARAMDAETSARLVEALRGGADPVAVAARGLDLIAEIEAASPLAILIDDVPWADNLSLQAIVFCVRRLRRERVLVLFTGRVSDVGQLPAGLHQHLGGPFGAVVRLDGFDDDEVAEFARTMGVMLGPRAAARLRRHTDGAPLHVKALLRELPADRLAGDDSQPLPAPASYGSLIIGRLAGLGEATEGFVAAASVLGSRSRLAQVAELAGTDRLAILDEAVAAGLVSVEETTSGPAVVFAHPLIHAAVYHDLSPSRRAELHARAAEVVDEPWARLRHLAASVASDDALAAELVEFADAAHTQGPAGLSNAAAAYRLAAGLVSDRATREDLLLRSLEHALALGDANGATAIIGEMDSFEDSPRLRYMSGLTKAVSGDNRAAAGLLASAWDAVAVAGPPDALSTDLESVGSSAAAHLALIEANAGNLAGALQWSERSLTLRGEIPIPGAHPIFTRAITLAGIGRAEEALELTPEPPADPTTFDSLATACATGRGVAFLWMDRLDEAQDSLMTAYEAGRRSGSFIAGILGLIYLSEAEFRAGKWDEALHHGELAVSLAIDSDQAWYYALAHGNLALPLAARGRFDAATEHADAARRTAMSAAHQMWADYAAAFIAWAKGDDVGVLDSLAGLVRDGAITDVPSVKPWPMLAAQSLASTGRIAEAREVLHAASSYVARRPMPVMKVAVGRAQAIIDAADGQPDEAIAVLDALGDAVERCPSPYEAALTRLVHGSLLRRANQRRAAAELLTSAAGTLERLKARPALERARRELAGCGLTPARRTDDARLALTPQEQTVAVLAARGERTKAIAAELLVSPKTVEFHLGNVYRKLGVSSRAQLAAHLIDT